MVISRTNSNSFPIPDRIDPTSATNTNSNQHHGNNGNNSNNNNSIADAGVNNTIFHQDQNCSNENESLMAKRRAIRQILSQSFLTEREKSLQIQQLMNGSGSNLCARLSSSLLLQNDEDVKLEHESQEQPLQSQAQEQPLQSQAQEQQLQSQAQSQAQTQTQTKENQLQYPQRKTLLSTTTVASVGGIVPCFHYERNCLIVAPCCGEIYGCRVCHDEFTKEEHGPMDRTKVTEIICKECHTRQPCSNRCVNLSCSVTEFAKYYCDKCNLWMGLEKKPFHCEDCGICRVGGREQYRHCSVCSMCIHAEAFETHICFKDKYKNHCPVCREDMHTSRHTSQDLPCGHAIHTHCFRKLAGFDYRCPICKKTVMNHVSMMAAWQERALDIQSQPMPRDLARVVNIMCYDCEGKRDRKSVL